MVSFFRAIAGRRMPVKNRLLATPVFVLALAGLLAADEKVPDNPAIDMEGYLKVAVEAARHREARRISEAEFIRMSREPGTIVLDARSREKFDELHVKGAINLSFPDIAIESLGAHPPRHGTRAS